MPLYGDEKREYQRHWLAERRSTWLKEHGPCVDCGVWDDLEVDHVDRETKVTHRVWSWSKARRDFELAKCVARCETCHQARTTSQLVKEVCLRGHDKRVTGRDLHHSRCSECRREDDRLARAEGRKK